MKVDFGKTAYVSRCGAGMIDAIEQHFNPDMTGDGLVCIDYEKLDEEVGELTLAECKGDKLKIFLMEAYLKINEALTLEDHRGDVVFAK